MLAVNDLLDVEEALEQEEDEGVKLEPFNLAQEREEGHFDEGGSYVENKEEDDPTMRDAWLTSKDGGRHSLRPSAAILHALVTRNPGSAMASLTTVVRQRFYSQRCTPASCCCWVLSLCKLPVDFCLS